MKHQKSARAKKATQYDRHSVIGHGTGGGHRIEVSTKKNGRVSSFEIFFKWLKKSTDPKKNWSALYRTLVTQPRYGQILLTSVIESAMHQEGIELQEPSEELVKIAHKFGRSREIPKVCFVGRDPRICKVLEDRTKRVSRVHCVVVTTAHSLVIVNTTESGTVKVVTEDATQTLNPREMYTVDKHKTTTVYVTEYRKFTLNPPTCVVCMDNHASVKYLPCNHEVVCEDCDRRLGDDCPMCRTPIKQMQFDMHPF